MNKRVCKKSSLPSCTPCEGHMKWDAGADGIGASALLAASPL